ncbi:MAG: autotransporter-associated beta strand repeat-containing protein, partial [Dissulfurispiraceae bacterium]
MTGATVILSTFDPTTYAADPISQEYQRRAAGYNYWVSPNADGTFSLPDVRPGTYRVTVIKPGVYREATFDNIVVSAGGTTNAGNLTWTPDISGKGVWQIGTFDRSSGEFHNGNNYNNYISTFDFTKDFPHGVSYTVNSANPFNDTQNWRANWPLYQQNPSQDFYSVNFNLASAPATNSTVTVTVALVGQEYINDLAILIGSNRVDASFDHTADNASIVYRSGDSSSREMFRKLSFSGSWLHAGSNTITFHIVGGNMEYDAVRMDIQDPGTFSVAQWDGSAGNWSSAAHWQTQAYGYTAINKGTSGIANDTSTTFADGATNTAPINNVSSSLYYDAVMNGGTLTLDTSASVQKLSLLQGTLNVASGSPTLTANDAFVLGGATFNGAGVINAQTTTAVNFNNTISGGAKVNSIGTVAWTDGQTSVTVTGPGSQWNTLGLSFGQTGASTLSIVNSGLVSTGTGTLTVGPQGTLSMTGGTLNTTGIVNSGSFSATGSSIALGTGSLVNSGTATISGGLSGSSVVNTGGTLILGGTNTYTGGTSITGGVVQFAMASSIGGSGANVSVNNGGAVSFVPGISNASFLARLNPASSGALALSGTDAATDLNFTAGPLASFTSMSLGAIGSVTYSGSYTPVGGIYRLGGGGGTLTYTSLISGSSSLVIGNSGSSGTVIVSAANSFTGTTTLKGGVLSVSSLANGGANSPLGKSDSTAANLIIDGGTLLATAAATTDRLFTLGAGGATLDGSGGAMNWTGTGSLAAGGASDRTFTLTGSNAGNIFSPAIADPASGLTYLVKDGSGAWTLNSAAHTYSGDTTVLNGTLKLGANGSLPSGAGKGNLVIAVSGTFEMNGRDVAINGLNDGPAPATGPTSPNGNGGGTLNNSSGTHTLVLGNGDASGLFSGVISGGINLVKVGSGTQILSGDNTYAGTTTISAGTLQVGVGGTPSSYGPGDGGLRGKLGAGNIVNNATLVFNRGYMTTCTNIISGTGSLKQIANAELVLGSANTYTGPTLIGDGIANIGQGGANDGTGLAYTGDCSLNASVLANGGAASSIGASTNAAFNLVLDGGTLYYSGATAASTDRLFTVTQNGGAIYASGGLTFTNGGAIVMSGSGDRTLSLGGDTTATCTFGSDIGDPAAGGKTSLTKDRSAAWVIAPTASLTYSGNTNLLMGTLSLGTGVALPYGAGKGDVVFGTSTDFTSAYPAKLELNGNDLNINGLSGGLATYSIVDNNSGTHTLSLGNNDATAEFAGKITGGINLVKVGSGTQTMDGSSTYTGSTTVNGGALIFSATATIGGSGKNVTIVNGATLGAPDSLVDQTFLNRLTTSSSGVFCLTSSESNNLDFSSAGANLPNVSLGAIGSVTMSGTVTANGTTYKLGGGGGTLTLTSSLTGSGNSLLIGAAGTGNGPAGTVILTATNSYGGGTTVNAGTVQFNTAAGIGGSGANVIVNSGAVDAAGYAIEQAFLARINSSSGGVVAL